MHRPHRWWVLAWAMVALSAPSSNRAVDPEMLGRLPPDIRELLAGADAMLSEDARQEERYLRAVVAQLRVTAEPGAGWLSVLDAITSEVLVEDLRGPQAPANAKAALGPGGERKVRLAQSMTFVVRDKAQGAALRFLEADLKIAPADLGDESGKMLGLDINLHAVAWLVAHEIAHHRLGHVGRRPASLAKSREWEGRADELAWKMLNRAGFSMPLLELYFEEWSALEEIRRRHALRVIPERLSTHPSWTTRLTCFRTFMRANRPVTARWTMLLLALKRDDGKPQLTRLLLPLGSDDRFGMEFAEGPSLPTAPTWIGIERTQEGAVRLYQRLGDAPPGARPPVSICVLEDPGAHYPLASCRIDGVAPSLAARVGFVRASFASWNMLDRSGAVGLMFQLDARSLARDVTRSITSDPQRIAAADRAVEAKYHEFHDVMFRMIRGDIDAQRATAELEAQARRYESALTVALGPEGARRHTAAVAERLVGMVSGMAEGLQQHQSP